jgi:hypothetical protein
MDQKPITKSKNQITMKRIILLSTVALLTMAFISGCTRSVGRNFDENYWLTQERADVVYSDSYCGYYVVETLYGYTIIRATSGYGPLEGSIMYGNFGNFGIRDFYDYSRGVLVRGEVIEYDLTYTEAQYAIDYYCPYGKANGTKIKESVNAQSKVKRTAPAGQQ